MACQMKIDRPVNKNRGFSSVGADCCAKGHSADPFPHRRRTQCEPGKTSRAVAFPAEKERAGKGEFPNKGSGLRKSCWHAICPTHPPTPVGILRRNLR